MVKEIVARLCLFINGILGVRTGFFKLNFEETPSQDERNTNLRRLTISGVVLTGQSDFPAFFLSVKLCNYRISLQ
jgi:hypothetical protein